MIPNKYNFFAMKQSHFFLTPMTWVTDTACNCLSISAIIGVFFMLSRLQAVL